MTAEQLERQWRLQRFCWGAAMCAIVDAEAADMARRLERVDQLVAGGDPSAAEAEMLQMMDGEK